MVQFYCWKASIVYEERHIAKYAINSVDRSKFSELGIFWNSINFNKSQW